MAGAMSCNWLGPFQVVQADPSRMRVKVKPYTTVEDRVGPVDLHVRYVKRLSTKYTGDDALLRAAADLDVPDNEIKALEGHVFRDDGLKIEVSWYGCDESENYELPIEELFKDAPSLVLRYLREASQADARLVPVLRKLTSSR